MSCGTVNNNAYELAITPSRKRKRESGNLNTIEDAQLTSAEVTPVDAGFSNEAYSSTPKEALGKRLLQKENCIQFLTNPCLEVKSIADIVLQNQLQKNIIDEENSKSAVPENPYEVVRKPPKKKKKRMEVENVCFENPALNLELPEKQFNPFEVRRPNASSVLTESEKGFVNEALNLRGQDVPSARNPFEILRCSAVSLGAANPAGVDNFAVEPLKPTNLKLELPFAPTLGCRIDFNNMSLSQLTPSKLLAEKLVFSPAPVYAKTPKRSLGSINEETMDIGKELDRYQLELENSINEAKLRKNACTYTNVTEEVTVEFEQKITFTQKLSEIEEEKDEEVEVKESKKAINLACDIDQIKFKNSLEQDEQIIELSKGKDKLLPLVTAEGASMDKPPILTEHLETSECQVDCNPDENDNFQDEDKLDFKAPTPFVRAYRRAEPPIPKIALTVNKKSIQSMQSDKSNECEPLITNNVKEIIRNSIRKFIQPQLNPNHKGSAEENISHESQQHKHPSLPTTIMSSIRHSLRRKPPKQQEQLIPDECLQVNEVSIIDSSERRMKFKSNQTQTEYAKIEDLTNEKKHSLRSSIRKSTRDVRNQFLKTVFHKAQDEYIFKK